MWNGVLVMNIRNNGKNKTTSNKQSDIVHNHTKSSTNNLIKSKELENRRIRKNTNLDMFRKHENTKVDRLRLTYRICRSQKAQMLNNKFMMSDSTIQLIDKFRAILNTMLDDEDGAYPKEEILNVSKELDDVIYYYYKILEQEKNG
jgi:hypothetical protein